MTISRTTAILSALAIFAAGALAAFLWPRRAPAPGAGPAATPVTSGASPGAAQVIQLSADLVARAGITVEPAATGAIAAAVRVPGTVQPNAYTQVSVTPLVSGRVTRMLVELGQPVQRGTPLAEVYSPEVAQARAAYLTARADIDAGEARLQRTERLAALGSASRQELESVRADHVRHETELREAAARLRLLGIDPAGVDDAHADPASTIVVVAPRPGVVIQRPATAGMTVEPSTMLATIAELSPVWVIADVYERDFGVLKTGAAATLASSAYPAVEWRGRITYVSPDVRPETRTAQARIEVANPDAKLKFGMFVTATVAAAATTGVTVPSAAVQTIGADAVVFVPDGALSNAFRERRVKLGPSSGDRVALLEGLAPGAPVVTRGSFELRAEAERQGVRPASVQTARVAITVAGFEPASVPLQAGVPARLTFTRTTNQTCATEIVLPAYGIRRTLPLNEPVTIEFVPTADGTAFQCGMGMLSGTLVVR